MTKVSPLREFRRPTVQTWVGALLVAALVLAEALAVSHELDAAAHANGQPCTVCLGTASLAAGAVTTPLHFDVVVATPLAVVAVAVISFSLVPTRRYARGPPAVSFTF
ncbi:MAG TPA: hypothetical protein VKA43_14795 [Gammaproteobacteria bacterium]|nr:hypothetical protein [Gammaproteobacteria bacterium]